jgi:hypothetical protein
MGIWYYPKNCFNLRRGIKMTLLPRMLILCVLLGVFGCGRVQDDHKNPSSSSSHQRTETAQDLQDLNNSLASLSDEASIEKAINDLENYANKKTNLGIRISSAEATPKTFSIRDDLKQKLIKAEMSLRTTSYESGIKTSGIEDDDAPDMTEEEYIRLREQELERGLSSQDIAAALNNAVSSQQSMSFSVSSIKSAGIKVANAINPFTENDIDLIRDKAFHLLPNSGDPSSERMNPLQAVIIGYLVASDDDGKKQDGEVGFLANQNQVDIFVDNITSTLGE